LGFVHTHIWQGDRNVGHLGAAGAGEFADPVDRVVIVEGQQVVAALPEGIGFADQFERAAGVLGEDDNVLFRRGVEELQNVLAGAFDQTGLGLRGWVGRVRVAEDVLVEQLVVPVDLRLGVQPPPV
jgi:hypothetical protein